LTKYPKDDVIFALQNLMENDTIIVKPNNLYSIK
jgi:ATP-dependent DNA helicase RecQ